MTTTAPDTQADLISGALRLHRIKGGQGIGSQACTEEDCQRKGRFMIEIAGWYVLSDDRYKRKELLCKRHAEEWLERWGGLSGEQVGGMGVAA